MVPPAPGRLSTIICWPSCWPTLSNTMRVTMSVTPDAPNGTMMRIGRVGQSAARAAPSGSRSSGAARSEAETDRRVVCMAFPRVEQVAFAAEFTARGRAINPHLRMSAAPICPVFAVAARIDSSQRQQSSRGSARDEIIRGGTPRRVRRRQPQGDLLRRHRGRRVQDRRRAGRLAQPVRPPAGPGVPGPHLRQGRGADRRQWAHPHDAIQRNRKAHRLPLARLGVQPRPASIPAIPRRACARRRSR